MLNEGRIPLTAKEKDAIDRLLKRTRNEDSVSMTRRDPGETGPVLVHINEDTFVVTDDKYRKLKNG